MLFSIIVLLGFSLIASSFAQSSIINFEVDEKSFAPGQIVELTGSVEPSLAGKPVAVEIKDSGGNVILIRTVTPDENGNFVLKFKIPTSAKPGNFEIISNVEVEGQPITESKTIEGPDVSELESVCGTGTVMKDGKCVPVEKPSGGGCLIATATFGTELAPQVQQLRELRDSKLLQTNSGTAFMTGFNQLYYSFSPGIADLERENVVFKEVVKLAITPLLTTLSILNYVDLDSEEKVLGYGIGIIMLNIGIYFTIPAITITKLYKLRIK